MNTFYSHLKLCYNEVIELFDEIYLTSGDDKDSLNLFLSNDVTPNKITEVFIVDDRFIIFSDRDSNKVDIFNEQRQPIKQVQKRQDMPDLFSALSYLFEKNLLCASAQNLTMDKYFLSYFDYRLDYKSFEYCIRSYDNYLHFTCLTADDDVSEFILTGFGFLPISSNISKSALQYSIAIYSYDSMLYIRRFNGDKLVETSFEL